MFNVQIVMRDSAQIKLSKSYENHRMNKEHRTVSANPEPDGFRKGRNGEGQEETPKMLEWTTI
jgi:hypothetical protein